MRGIKGGDDMADKSEIKRVLEHLAWLKEQVGEEVNRDRAYDAALLTYNAAVMLQWHFVMPMSEADQIQNEADRKKAAKLIDDFVKSVRTLVEKSKHARPDTEPMAKCREELLSLFKTLLKRLPKKLGLARVAISRDSSLEPPPRLRALLSRWLEDHSEQLQLEITAGRNLAHEDRDDSRRPFSATVADVVLAIDSPACSRMSSATRDVVRQIAAGTLATEIEMAVGESRAVKSRWWRALARSMCSSG
jgi:hypothetical protein